MCEKAVWIVIISPSYWFYEGVLLAFNADAKWKWALTSTCFQGKEIFDLCRAFSQTKTICIIRGSEKLRRKKEKAIRHHFNFLIPQQVKGRAGTLRRAPRCFMHADFNETANDCVNKVIIFIKAHRAIISRTSSFKTGTCRLRGLGNTRSAPLLREIFSSLSLSLSLSFLPCLWQLIFTSFDGKNFFHLTEISCHRFSLLVETFSIWKFSLEMFSEGKFEEIGLKLAKEVMMTH